MESRRSLETRKSDFLNYKTYIYRRRKKREFLISLTAAIKVSKAVTISTSLEKINISFIILIIIIN